MISEAEMCSKLALTGTCVALLIKQTLVIIKCLSHILAFFTARSIWNRAKETQFPNVDNLTQREYHGLDAGIVRDCLVDEKELAQYFLSILNSGDEYKKWAERSSSQTQRSFTDGEAEHASHSDLEMKRKRRYASDHTQVWCCFLIEFTYSSYLSDTYNWIG